MISNFSEVEKSLKRCLKEKVSITAATVVGFLIAGTVAFGTATNVTVKGSEEGKITIAGVGSTGSDKVIENRKDGKLTVGDILNKEGTAPIDSLAGLLTVSVEDKAAIIKGNYEGGSGLGTLTISSSENQGVTFLTTDKDYTSITSNLNVEVTGQDGKSATAMEAAEEGHTVTNAGEITVNKYAVGMVAGAGATAVNDKNSGESAGITVNADTGEANTAIGMVADGDKATATNNGKIDAQKGIGMLAKNGATIENSTDATIEAGNNEDTSAGTGMLVTGNGTATNNGTINVNYTGSIGMSTTTVADSTTTLTNNGTIDVKAGTGISVAGAGEAIVTGGTISVDNVDGNIGINIAGTGTTTVTGAAITLAGEGTGINAEGNVTLENIELNFGDNATGTGIKYAGGTSVAEANIITGDMLVTGNGEEDGATGIDATMSSAKESKLTIKIGIISTVEGATGIKIAGTTTDAPGEKTPTTATVTTTLGKTEGTGVEVTGKANNIINVTLQDTQTPTSKTPISIAKGIDVAGNEEGGIINIDVNQSNLQVAKSGNLVNIGDVAGTTNVNINKDIKVATEGTGNIVKAGAITSGTLNINLNVGDKNTTSESLNVTEGNTALNLANVGDGTTFVKNTGNVTIEGTGKLINGHDTNAISLTNQGLIDLKVVDKANKEDGNSVISSGTGVNVANYGTIKLNIELDEFLGVAEVKSLDELTTEKVQNALKTLGVSDAGTFSNLGYIELTDGKYAAGTELKSGETYNIDSLKSVLDQPATEVRAFKIKEGDEVTFTSEKADDKLSNVNLNIDGKLNIKAASTVAITNAKDAHILNIGKEGQLVIDADATLNYSGTISAKNVNTAEAAIAVTNTGTLTLANGALNMVAPESKTALLSEPANRVGIELTGAGTTELDNYTVNADIKGKLTGGSTLQGTLSAKGKSRITGNVTDIKNIEVTDNGMLTFGADSKIESGATSGTTATTIDLANGNMGVEIGEKGKNGMLTFGANSKIIVSGAAKAAGKTTEIDLANGNMGVEIGEKGK
ncbi:beta strand repeat-containing protein, partial [Fusobacterium varium]|uniref:beta strand repeat-containing protein n=1 Tax=Fusobacterium varium TaxID=856 RepID=UPI0022E74C7A